MKRISGDGGTSSFVARLLDGEGMSVVCREFGISRKTGCKIFNRYKEQGLDALADCSRRPVRYANQLPDQVERLIVGLTGMASAGVATTRSGKRRLPTVRVRPDEVATPRA